MKSSWLSTESWYLEGPLLNNQAYLGSCSLEASLGHISVSRILVLLSASPPQIELCFPRGWGPGPQTSPGELPALTSQGRRGLNELTRREYSGQAWHTVNAMEAFALMIII